MRFQAKRALHWVGSSLGAAGVVFVGFKLAQYGEQIEWARFSPAIVLGLGSLCIAYAGANSLLAMAWWQLLRHFGMHAGGWWVQWAYGTSQLARYVPGNIFHLAGRQAIGQAAGLPAWPLAKSAVWELGLISVCGALFAILTAPFFFSEVSDLLAVVVFAATAGAGILLSRKVFSAWVASAATWYVSFLALSGCLFVAVLHFAVPGYAFLDLSMVGICGAYVVAWLAGLLTPGAPAGVGVRELVLFTILQGVVTQAELVMAVVLGRAVTVGGDIVYYAFALGVASGKRSLSKED